MTYELAYRLINGFLQQVIELSFESNRTKKKFEFIS